MSQFDDSKKRLFASDIRPKPDGIQNTTIAVMATNRLESTRLQPIQPLQPMPQFKQQQLSLSSLTSFRSRFISRIYKAFIPQGHLDADFFQFMRWRLAVRFIAAISGVFGAQSLLLSLGRRHSSSSSMPTQGNIMSGKGVATASVLGW